MGKEVVVALIGLITALVGVVGQIVGRRREFVHRHEHIHLDSVDDSSVATRSTNGFLSKGSWLFIGTGLIVTVAALFIAADEFRTTIKRVDGEKVIVSDPRGKKTGEEKAYFVKKNVNGNTDDPIANALRKAMNSESDAKKGDVMVRTGEENGRITEVRFGGRKKKER